MKTLHPAEIKRQLNDGQEIAFLDVREPGQFGEGHPFLAIPLPYSRLEVDVVSLVPRRSTRIVLIDNDDGIALKAAAALRGLGYTQVAVCLGGAAGWAQAGFVLFQGVNLPSKTFGELVEHAFDTPHITAAALDARRRAGETIVVLDGRPLAEFNNMSIPGAVCCPNGELALRYRELVGDDDTTIVINCAGRTRSIIGTQTLIDMGVPNPVYALENGTQGWYLQDFPLAHGRSDTYPQTPARPTDASLRQAQALAQAHGVCRVDADTLGQWAADPDRTVYFLDIRSPQEYRDHPIAGAAHAPGGQLIQATDQYVGTRGARLVIVDTDGVRAPVVATWLRRLGHDAYLAAPTDVPAPAPAPSIALLPELSASALLAQAASFRLLDLRASARFRQGHIDGAQWSIRPRLTQDAGRTTVFIADEPALAALAARDLGAPAYRLAGTPQDWFQAGLRIVVTPDQPPDSERIDFLFFVHDRHGGNKAAARQYLAWETGLVAQLDADETALFRLPAAATDKTAHQA